MLLKNKINCKGFTLIEVLIAMTIISIILPSFFTITNSSIKQNSKNEKDIKSLNIAQSELESLRKQIKSSTNEILLYKDDGTELIKIPNETAVIWESDGIVENIKINPNGIYKLYRDVDEQSKKEIIKYCRKLEEDSTEYIVKLDLSRQQKGSKYLYKITIKVKSENSLSIKETVLSTSILSK